MKFLILNLMLVTSFFNYADVLKANADFPAGANKYEILRNAYEAEKTPASLHDFEVFKPSRGDRSQECVYTDRKDKYELFYITAAIAKKVIPGTPALGPLFPAIPNKTISKLMVGNRWFWEDVDGWKNLTAFKNFTTKTDFVAELATDFYTGVRKGGQFRFRKSSNYLPFKIVNKAANGKYVTLYYGYCYGI